MEREIFVRWGGSGPAVVLIHGFGDTGDMWGPLAADLAKDHTVVVPDLRGMGLSSTPRRLRQEDPGRRHTRRRARSASTAPQWCRTTSAPWWRMPMRHAIPRRSPPGGDGRAGPRRSRPWDEVVRNPRCGTSVSAAPTPSGWSRDVSASTSTASGTTSRLTRRFDEATRAHYAKLYARPGAMRAGFAQFAAFDQDANDNAAFQAAS